MIRGFNKYVKLIEMEISSYCNRRCIFCGNYFIDRQKENHFMNEAVFNNIVKDLYDVQYSNYLNFSRFNEPFAFKMILERIQYVRKALPFAILTCFSNGDYLNKEYLDEIADYGLDFLNITLYLEDSSSKDEMYEQLERLVKRLGNYPYHELPTESNHILRWKLKFKKMSVTIEHKKLSEYGMDRGGIIQSLQKEKRDVACYRPLISMAIDYNGNVMPCCHLRSDYEGHEPYILGNLLNEHLLDIYANDKSEEFRKMLLKQNCPECCTYCLDAN